MFPPFPSKLKGCDTVLVAWFYLCPLSCFLYKYNMSPAPTCNTDLNNINITKAKVHVVRKCCLLGNNQMKPTKKKDVAGGRGEVL